MSSGYDYYVPALEVTIIQTDYIIKDALNYNIPVTLDKLISPLTNATAMCMCVLR